MMSDTKRQCSLPWEKESKIQCGDHSKARLPDGKSDRYEEAIEEAYFSYPIESPYPVFRVETRSSSASTEIPM